MKIAEGLTEDGTIIGNTFDKYGSDLFVVRRIMRGFDDALMSFINLATPRTIHEVGCGEGYWTLQLYQQGYDVRGSDFSAKIVDIARVNAQQAGVTKDLFEVKDIYDLDADDSADLVICCEVLEHLEDPERALQALLSLDAPVILSVPREPLWGLLNMARGKYWTELGNTPGHLQRWSKQSFIKILSLYYDVVEVRSPLPWTMVYVQPENLKQS